MNSSIFPPPYSGNQIFPYVTHLRGEFFENKFSELFFFFEWLLKNARHHILNDVFTQYSLVYFNTVHYT